MKVLIVVGGGGHFAPAFTVINSLPKDWQVLVVGRKHAFEGDKAESLEFRTAKEQHIPFVSLTTGRFQRKFTKHTIPSLTKFPYGFLQAMRILLRYKPNVVLSFGGYVSLPVVFAASSLKIPIVIHEQTLEAGLANRMASRFATKICISWESSAKFFPKTKTVLTGNPLERERHDVANLLKFPTSNTSPLLFVTGGSGGSHAINMLIEGCLEKLLGYFRVFHQTGDAQEFGDFERLEKKRSLLEKDLQDRYLLTKFLSHGEFSGIVFASDLVVSRAGMNTITELMHYGKPAVIIPLPYAQKNEQMKNARFMESFGLAIVESQNSLTSEKLINDCLEMLAKKDTLDTEKVKIAVKIDGVQTIIEILTQVAKKPAHEKL